MKLDKEKILQAIQDEPTQEEIDYLTSLDEMAVIGWDERKGLTLHVNPGEQFVGGDYFKVYNSASENHATKLARINFAHPIYTIHAPKWNRGKDYLWLNSREKRDLIEFLNSQNADHPEYTNWQYAILEFNKGKRISYEQTKANLLRNGRLNIPNALPYDLPMPNYMLLPADKDQNKQRKQEIERALDRARQEVQTPIRKKKRGK